MPVWRCSVRGEGATVEQLFSNSSCRIPKTTPTPVNMFIPLPFVSTVFHHLGLFLWVGCVRSRYIQRDDRTGEVWQHHRFEWEGLRTPLFRGQHFRVRSVLQQVVVGGRGQVQPLQSSFTPFVLCAAIPCHFPVSSHRHFWWVVGLWIRRLSKPETTNGPISRPLNTWLEWPYK